MHTLEDADGGSKVVDTTGGLQSGGDDGGGGNQVVGEGVVEVTLLLREKKSQPRPIRPLLCRG